MMELISPNQEAKRESTMAHGLVYEFWVYSEVSDQQNPFLGTTHPMSVILQHHVRSAYGP